jgi:ParB family transcriptional regulator, chromosome partitioning protein
VLGSVLIKLTIVLSATRRNSVQVFRDAAAAYKMDTDAVALKVKQEFSAKERARVAKRPSPKGAANKLRKTA